MSNEPEQRRQPPVTLWAAAGVYLIYTAWKLRTAVAERPLFLIPIIFFAAAGLFLIACPAFKMWKDKKEQPTEAAAEESAGEDG